MDLINALCNQCNAVILCKCANTSNMLKHLSTQNGFKYQEYVVFKSLRTSQTNSTVSSVDDGNDQVERENFPSKKNVKQAAITADGWTWLAQDHYTTVTVHYTKQGKILGKVLRTRAVYEAQNNPSVLKDSADPSSI